MDYAYDIDEIKNTLTLDNVFDLLEELGGEPILQGNTIISKTICHCGNSHKLFYYDNTRLCHCYTDCSASFDLLELTQKVKSQEYKDYSLPKAIRYVAQKFSFQPKEIKQENEDLREYLKGLRRYEALRAPKPERVIDLRDLELTWYQNLPQPRIADWEEEDISYDIIKLFDIRYDPVSQGIIIPHYDEEGQLIGIRERTLIKENEKYGKYRPAQLNGKQYNHPLGMALYGLHLAKENIAATETAIIFEGEKSVLRYVSYFGEENNIAVAACGSSLSEYQIELLRKYGAKNIIIAFDKCGSDDKEEIAKYVKKFYQFQARFGSMVNLSFLYDKDNRWLDLKDSPIDKGKNIFLQMFNERISLYGY